MHSQAFTHIDANLAHLQHAQKKYASHMQHFLDISSTHTPTHCPTHTIRRDKIGSGEKAAEVGPTHCAIHKVAGHLDLMHRRCGARECCKVPIFGSPTDGIARWCNRHRSLEIHVDLMHRICTRAQCVRPSIYGILGDKRPTHCKEHMTKGMVLLTPEARRRQDFEWDASFKLAADHVDAASRAALHVASRGVLHAALHPAAHTASVSSNDTHTSLASTGPGDVDKLHLNVERWLRRQGRLLHSKLLNGEKADQLALLLHTQGLCTRGASTPTMQQAGGATLTGDMERCAANPDARPSDDEAQQELEARGARVAAMYTRLPTHMWRREHVEHDMAGAQLRIETKLGRGRVPSQGIEHFAVRDEKGVVPSRTLAPLCCDPGENRLEGGRGGRRRKKGGEMEARTKKKTGKGCEGGDKGGAMHDIEQQVKQSLKQQVNLCLKRCSHIPTLQNAMPNASSSAHQHKAMGASGVSRRALGHILSRNTSRAHCLIPPAHTELRDGHERKEEGDRVCDGSQLGLLEPDAEMDSASLQHSLQHSFTAAFQSCKVIAYTHTHMHTQVQAHTHVHRCAHVHTHAHTRTRTQTHTSTHSHTHPYTHRHTHTRTYTHSLSEIVVTLVLARLAYWLIWHKHVATCFL